MTAPETTGSGWGNICNDCFGYKVERPKRPYRSGLRVALQSEHP